jgi:uncharacterized protein (TIGR02246 family)
MIGTVQETHGRLADDLRIRALVHRYADASSRRDPAGVARTFTSDGEWRSPALGSHQGREALVAFFAPMLKDWNAFFQGLLSGVVAFDTANDDMAAGRWFVEEIGQRSEGANLTVSGVYHDEYVRKDGAWLISRRRYDPLLIRADDSVTALPFPTDVSEIG